MREAKDGETIRVTNAHPFNDEYKNGDVLKVVKACKCDSTVYARVMGCTTHGGGKDTAILEASEYEVLDMNAPMNKESYRIGDMVEIVKSCPLHGEYKLGDKMKVVGISKITNCLYVHCKGQSTPNMGKDTTIVHIKEVKLVIVEPKILPVVSPKIGDVIEVTKPYIGSPYNTGERYVICRVSDSKIYVKGVLGHYTHNAGLDTALLWEGEYKLIVKSKPAKVKTAPVKKAQYAKITKDVGGAPVGTIVKINSMNQYGGIVYSYGTRERVHGTIGANAELVEFSVELRKWTPEEIMESKMIIAEIMFATTHSWNITSLFDVPTGSKITSYINGKEYSARCCKTDEWNFWVGKMISLCKAVGREFPAWIKEGK